MLVRPGRALRSDTLASMILLVVAIVLVLTGIVALLPTDRIPTALNGVSLHLIAAGALLGVIVLLG